jgi:hypothetical protein
MDIRFVGVYYAKHTINQNSGFTWIRVCSPFNVLAVNDTAVKRAQVRVRKCACASASASLDDAWLECCCKY